MEAGNNNEKFPRIVRSQFEQLGTEIDIQVVAEDEAQVIVAEKNIQEIKKLYLEFVRIFSRFDLKSELSELNLAVGRFNLASQHMCEIVSQSLEYNKKTNGFYDPRILEVLEKIGYADDFEKGIRQLAEKGYADDQNFFLNCGLVEDLKIEKNTVFFGTRMDFSGIAKGYITDQIAEFLIQQKWKNFLVDSGGDMFMCGVDEDGKKWTVNVEGIDEKKLIFVLDNNAIATSGIGKRRWEIAGKRMNHIINPKNPEQFSFDLKSVSVIAESTTEADVWAKTLFLMGKEDGMLYAREHDIATVILDSRGTAWISPKAKEYSYKNI